MTQKIDAIAFISTEFFSTICLEPNYTSTDSFGIDWFCTDCSNVKIDSISFDTNPFTIKKYHGNCNPVQLNL